MLLITELISGATVQEEDENYLCTYSIHISNKYRPTTKCHERQCDMQNRHEKCLYL
jgi:hypothetical protein